MRKGGKRQAILDAALACVVEKGYHSSTVDEISKRAGVSKGSVYWYFKSKKEIFKDVLNMYAEKWLAALDALFEEEKDPKEAICSLFEMVRERMEDREKIETCQALLEYWAFAARDKEVKIWVEELYRKYKMKVLPMLEAGIKSGTIKGEDPDEVFSLISLVSIGGVVIPLVNENVLGIKRNWDKIVRFLIKAITQKV